MGEGGGGGAARGGGGGRAHPAPRRRGLAARVALPLRQQPGLPCGLLQDGPDRRPPPPPRRVSRRAARAGRARRHLLLRGRLLLLLRHRPRRSLGGDPRDARRWRGDCAAAALPPPPPSAHQAPRASVPQRRAAARRGPGPGEGGAAGEARAALLGRGRAPSLGDCNLRRAVPVAAPADAARRAAATGHAAESKRLRLHALWTERRGVWEPRRLCQRRQRRQRRSWCLRV
mmetsp:Transcript_25185/g.80510  ORF Transcript_25185/g.80510 Transcript_25185/m.80510 type:complete len:230 (+) Transcript_25185:426-1115(+)